MNSENDILPPGLVDDFDEPYTHTASTEEFVEAVERGSRTENNDRPASNSDPGGNC